MAPALYRHFSLMGDKIVSNPLCPDLWGFHLRYCFRWDLLLKGLIWGTMRPSFLEPDYSYIFSNSQLVDTEETVITMRISRALLKVFLHVQTMVRCLKASHQVRNHSKAHASFLNFTKMSHSNSSQHYEYGQLYSHFLRQHISTGDIVLRSTLAGLFFSLKLSGGTHRKELLTKRVGNGVHCLGIRILLWLLTLNLSRPQ